MLLRDWPLVLVICFANFLTNIIAWGPMPPVVEKHSGAKVPFRESMLSHHEPSLITDDTICYYLIIDYVRWTSHFLAVFFVMI